MHLSFAERLDQGVGKQGSAHHAVRNYAMRSHLGRASPHLFLPLVTDMDVGLPAKSGLIRYFCENS